MEHKKHSGNVNQQDASKELAVSQKNLSASGESTSSSSVTPHTYIDPETPFGALIARHARLGKISSKVLRLAESFYIDYQRALATKNESEDLHLVTMDHFLTEVGKQIISPFSFEPYHKAERAPFDYYRFGLDFVRPLIDMKNSTLSGEEHLQRVAHWLEIGENVVFIANHQTEVDPQIINIMLEPYAPSISPHIVCVAGERVLSDPMAAPISRGCNLLCVYSKKYLDVDPQKRAEKQLHNKRVMGIMSRLFDEGSCAIYIALSGGRDRKDANGAVHLSKFDPQSVEMLRLFSRKSKRTTHFIPLALATYTIMPPPESTQIALGERRATSYDAVHIAFGPELDQHLFETDPISRDEQRDKRAQCYWQAVNSLYSRFPNSYIPKFS